MCADHSPTEVPYEALLASFIVECFFAERSEKRHPEIGIFKHACRVYVAGKPQRHVY